MTKARRHLRSGAGADEEQSTSGKGGSAPRTQLVVVGYDESTGEALYAEKPCVSNDNDRPYADGCSEAPSAMPVAAPSSSLASLEGGGGEGGGGGGGMDDAPAPASASASAGEGSAGGRYAYECASSRYCNSHGPPGEVGWTFLGPCAGGLLLLDGGGACPGAYDEGRASGGGYAAGDRASVSSEELASGTVAAGGVSCPGGGGAAGAGAAAARAVVVPYVYEVETYSVSDAGVFLPRLEERILLNLSDGMMSCLGGGGRGLEEAIGVVGIDSRPDDVAVTEGPCTLSASQADNCFVVDGKLTLLLDPNDDDEASAAATAAAQANLESAMADDELLSPNMPEVIRVRYLGDSYEGYLAGYVGRESDLAASGSVAGDIGAGENGGASSSGGRRGGGGGGGAFSWGVLGGALGALFVVVLFAFLLVNRKRRRGRADAEGRRRRAMEQESQLVGMDFDWEDWNDESLEGDASRGGELAEEEAVVLVTGLGRGATERVVRDLAAADGGEVAGCVVAPDREDGGRSFALLSMPAASDAQRASVAGAIGRLDGLALDGGDGRLTLSSREVTTLWAGNLGPDATEGRVRDLFERHGSVEGCAVVPADHHYGNGSDPRRFALVTMPVEGARGAIAQLNGVAVDGGKLVVRDAARGGRPGAALAAAVLAMTGRAPAAFGGGAVVLRVENLGPRTGPEELRELFEHHGDVAECVVRADEGGGGRGGSGGKDGRSTSDRYALVIMPVTEEAFSACNRLDGFALDGRRLRVRVAREHLGPMRSLMDDASSAYDNTTCDGRNRTSGVGAGGTSALVAAGALAGALLLMKPCRKRSRAPSDAGDGRRACGDTQQSLDDGLDDIINNIDGAVGGDVRDRRNFVIDPPGAFHLGNHHYTGAGVRYFSPLCAQCVAARADADGVVALTAMDHEDDDDYDGGADDAVDLTDGNNLSFDLDAARKFTDFNANDLGRCHSSMHVRHCKSTTCDLCRKERGVRFVKARKELSV